MYQIFSYLSYLPPPFNRPNTFSAIMRRLPLINADFYAFSQLQVLKFELEWNVPFDRPVLWSVVMRCGCQHLRWLRKKIKNITSNITWEVVNKMTKHSTYFLLSLSPSLGVLWGYPARCVGVGVCKSSQVILCGLCVCVGMFVCVVTSVVGTSTHTP